MKLFLSSLSVQKAHQPAFVKLVGKPAEDVKIVVIENASDVYPEERRGFVDRDRDALKAVGLKLNYLDLKDYFGKGDLAKDLGKFDVIWLGGGNTYYLRWACRESGFDKVIHQLVDNGMVLGGGSAGAIVIGPTLKNFEPADSPEEAPGVIYEGLGLTDIVPLPHWANEKYGHIMQGIKDEFDKTDFRVIPITDDQAIVIDGEKVTVVP